jgi:hypothetical protein
LADRLLEADAKLATKDVDHRAVALLSIGYLMTMTREVMRTRPGKFVDVMIVMAIFHGNADKKLGVSRNAVSKKLNIPLETARRHINNLIQKGTLVEQGDGLIFVNGADFKPGQRSPLVELHLQQLRLLVRALKELGVEFD